MNYGGPVAATPAAAQMLVARGDELAREFGADYLELRCAAPLETSMLVSLRKISMTVPLMSDPETLFDSFTQQTSQQHPARAEERPRRRRWRPRTPAGVLFDARTILAQSRHTAVLAALLRGDRRHFPATACASSFAAGRTRPIAVALNGHGNGASKACGPGARPRAAQPRRELRAVLGNAARRLPRAASHASISAAPPPIRARRQFKSKWNAEAQQLYWYFHRPDGGQMPALNVDNPKYRWRFPPGAACRCGRRAGRPAAGAADSVSGTIDDLPGSRRHRHGLGRTCSPVSHGG